MSLIDIPQIGVLAYNINGKITFFEDNTDRRAYCKAVAGERMNLYSTSAANTDNFVRNECMIIQ